MHTVCVDTIAIGGYVMQASKHYHSKTRSSATLLHAALVVGVVYILLVMVGGVVHHLSTMAQALGN